jgi:hypothetical protein
VLYTYFDDVVKIIVFSICHVVCEHLNNLWQIEFSSSAELEQKVVEMPWVLGNLIDFNPLFELIQTLLLRCR